MRKAITIRHVPFEDLGTLVQFLRHHDYDYSYIDAGREPLPIAELKTTDLLIVMGGPVSANDENVYPFLAELRQIIASRIEHRMPTLGICLGAQIIARACGVAVYANPCKEIGWSPVELTTAGMQSCLRHLQNIPVLHWHGETFAIPEVAEHLAQTALCNNQAFQIERHTLGLQFHPEVTAEGLESWYIGHTVELNQAGIDINRLRQMSRNHAPPLATAADSCFSEWLQQLSKQD